FLGPDCLLDDEALAALCAHPWPGNVRELRNVIERARLLCGNGVIRVSDLGLPSARRLTGRTEEPDRNEIESSLQSACGNVSRAAQALGLPRQALYRRMERLGMKS